MKYQSTRNKKISVTSAAAIIKGLSPDGGLFVPEEMPFMGKTEIEELAKMSYRERAANILGRFLTDFDENEISRCVNAAYTAEKFGSEEIAPIYKLCDDIFILELWHGPTCAFKDMALQILPHLLTRSAKKEGLEKEVVILVATSGDTGKAALAGFCDVPGTKIAVFFPENGVSRIQKLQMTTQQGNNVFVSAVKGNFDDAQNGVKRIFTDKEFGEKLDNAVLSSANSINWGRLVPQIVYYFSAYADMLSRGEIKCGEKINMVVPTGNFGNILAAYYAKKMGLFVNRLICASNSNNVLTDFISTGVYDRNRQFSATISPSMDILISSNLERLLYDITGGDDTRVSSFMESLRATGKYDIGKELHEKVKEVLWGGYCGDTDTMTTIKAVYDKYSYVVDTHTAVAVKVYYDYVKETGDDTKTVIASTASPYKFADSVVKAILGGAEMHHASVQVEGLKVRTILNEDAIDDDFEIIDILRGISKQPVPRSLEELKTKKPKFDSACEPEDMKSVLMDFLNIK